MVSFSQCFQRRCTERFLSAHTRRAGSWPLPQLPCPGSRTSALQMAPGAKPWHRGTAGGSLAGVLKQARVCHYSAGSRGQTQQRNLQLLGCIPALGTGGHNLGYCNLLQLTPHPWLPARKWKAQLLTSLQRKAYRKPLHPLSQAEVMVKDRAACARALTSAVRSTAASAIQSPTVQGSPSSPWMVEMTREAVLS